MAVGQHQWYHFGVGAPPILVDLVGTGMFTGCDNERSLQAASFRLAWDHVPLKPRIMRFAEAKFAT